MWEREKMGAGLVVVYHSIVHGLEGNTGHNSSCLSVAVESGGVGSASFPAYPGHSWCDPSLISSSCLWKIGCMINPPLGYRVTWMSHCKTKLCATAGARETIFTLCLRAEEELIY